MVSGKLGYLTFVLLPVVSSVLTIDSALVYEGTNLGSTVTKTTAQLTTTSATNIRHDREIVLVFSEAVQAGAASTTLTLTDASGSSTYSFLVGPTSTTDAVISAAQVTVRPQDSGANLLELTTYTISVTASMFVDVATGAKYNSALTAYFVTGDFTAPAITNYNPAQLTPNVAVASNLVLTFTETVQAVSTGQVSLTNYHAAYSSNSASIMCNLLTYSGNTVTIVPSAFYTFNGGAMEHCSMFMVTMTGVSGCITDASPNANLATFGAISGSTSPPIPTALGTWTSGADSSYLFWTSCIVSIDPPNAQEDVLINSSITITFSENVQAYSGGEIYVTPLGQTRGNTACSLSPNSDCALYWSTFGNAQVVIAGPAVTITPSSVQGLCSDAIRSLKDSTVTHQYQNCKGKPFNLEFYGAQETTNSATQAPAFARATQQAGWTSPGVCPSGYTDILPTQLIDTDHTYTLEPNDYTPPTMTIVSMYGISETVIRVTVRLDESGTVYCQAFTRSPSPRTTNPTILEIGDPVSATNVQMDCDAGNHNACMRAVYDAQYGFAETEVDISTTYYPGSETSPYSGSHPTGGSSLVAETMYDVYCYALDATLPEVTSGVSEANVVNSATMLATKKIVRTLDMTPPTFSSFTCATSGETSVTATLVMSEWGTSYCKVVHKDHPAPSPNAVIAEGFSYVFTGTLGTSFDIVVNEITTGLGATGREPLRLKTDYDLYCWAQDDEGYPYYGPNGMAAAVQCTSSPLTTFDQTRPKMRYITAESVSKSQIHITLQVDEGSKVWCAAWQTDPSLTITAGAQNYMTAIKAQAASGVQDCMDIHKNSCGNFWIYDLDDIEDGDSESPYAVTTQAEYDSALWKQDRDVEILLNNLDEEVDYQYIYCHAEDDETGSSCLGGACPNVMQFDTVSNAGPDNVVTIRNAFGTVQTLDESMPIFRQLEIYDPTANNDRIIVTFTLNEDGTAYCRVTRSDSGETNLKINRILTADWSNVYDQTTGSAKMITITSLENALYSDPIIESQEYDIYCWAKDSAVDTAGNARPNYQTQAYVNQLVTAPQGLDGDSNGEPDPAGGGATKRVWVVDSTPPTMIFVSGEAIAEDRIQLTLQLNEPGTIWCTPVALSSAAGTEVKNSNFGNGLECHDNAGLAPGPTPAPTYYENCIKGTTNGAVFVVYVPEAYRNVDLEMNMVASNDQTTATSLIGGSTPASAETDYNYWCFAEDEWSTQAPSTTGGSRSVNYVPSGQTPANNKVVYATSEAFKNAIGLIKTLDLTPPVLTMSTTHAGGCSTTTETTITVTLKLNEQGTAWCKVVRHNFDPPTILEILDADFSNTFLADTDDTILIQGYDRPINSDHNYTTPLVLATDYDIYCYATDDLCNNCKVTNGMSHTAVLATECKTRTLDNTPPRMKFVAAESISWHQILITLQVDEGAKVWCGAWTAANNPTGAWTNNGLEHETAIEGWGAPGTAYDCYENTPLKRRCGEFWVYDLDDIEDGDSNDDVTSQAQYDAATWKYDQDVEIIVDGLTEEIDYPRIYCYAEDDEDQMTGGMVYDENALGGAGDWYGTAKSLPNKMIYHTSASAGPQNSHTISQDAGGVGTIQTLDESPPIFDKLMIQDPTAFNDRIIVTFTLNEDGTAYCRVTRSDSGETNLKINRILTADWSSVYTHAPGGGANREITITSLENALYSDPIIESQEYDIYCWAKDSAIDTAANARPNYMTQSYVEQLVSDPSMTANPAGGGTTKKVWVVDSTPPTMIFVSGEAIAEDRIQLTLQLNEPGTIWCTPVALTTSTGEVLNSDWAISGQTCDETATALTPFSAPNQACSPVNGTGCATTPFEACIKGTNNGAVFVVYVPEAYRNVDLEMNLIANAAQNANSPLIGGSTAETDYNYQCFAEDEWSTQAAVGTTYPARSIHYPSGQTPTNNKITLTTSESFKTAIGNIKTLDLTPPVITMATSLGGGCSETTETNITVTLQLNEIGTAWCKVVRHNFDPPTILEILDADYSNTFSKDTDNTILISGYDRPINSDHSYETPLVLATDYDIYCYATDDLCNNCKVTNGVSYAHVLSTQCKTRTTDDTPPRMKYVAAESISKQQILITLQVDEGSQVWCGAWTSARTWVDGNYDHETDIEQVAAIGNCYENTPAKRPCGSFWVYDLDDIEDGDATDLVTTQASYDSATWFANQDVEIIVDGLDEQVDYPYIYCFAEDDEDTLLGMVYDPPRGSSGWVHTGKASPNKMWYHTTGTTSMPLGPQNTHTISQGVGGIGTIQTLDESPPIFQTLKIQDPTAVDDTIVVTFTLNEDGTAWCRVTRSDSGETNLKINRILTADWSGIYTHGTTPVPTPNPGPDITIAINKLEQKAGSETIKQETQYDVYCWAKDSAVDTHNNARPNYQAQSYVETDIGSNVLNVLGGKTQYVWVTDSTNPQMIYVASEAIAETTVQVTLQLDEPGTVWCAIARPNGAADQSSYCTEAEIPSNSNCGNSLYETYIKGSSSVSSITGMAPIFTQQVHVPYVDYDLDLNLIQEQSTSNSQPLKALSGYKVYCFAEDNWDLEALNSANHSMNFDTTAPVQNKVDNTAVEALRDVIGTVVTLDTSPAAFLSSAISQVDETQLQVVFTLDEVGTVYCKPVRKLFATPTLNEILAYGESVSCNPSCTMNVGSVIALTPKTEYDVHCVSEDDNVYPQVTNLYQRPALTQPTMDLTPPSIHIIEAESPYNDRIVVKLQLNEVGTVWCLSRPTANANTMTSAVVKASGNSEVVDNVGWYVDQNTQIVVTNLDEEIEYVTRCYAEDSPDGLHWTVANPTSQTAVTATQAVLGPIITLDVSPPKFTYLKAEGTQEGEITVTFDLNEAGTAYCRATRSDSGEATMHINRILKADWSQTYVSTQQTIVIDRLENDASSSSLERGTYYDVFCWIRDAAVKHSCRAGPDGVTPAICGTTYTPVGQTQTYVDTQFGGTGGWKVPPSQTGETSITGGLIASPGVRTRDITAPTIIFVEAESTAETSITITLQLSEPGTVYCEAYTSTGTPAVKTDCSYSSCQYVVSSWAETYRNFEVTVTKGTGLTMETNYYVYCGGEDDESGETQYSLGNTNNGGAFDTNNIAANFLTESTGRFTLDLTPPVLQVLTTTSALETQITLSVQLDEPGTVWCLGVRDNFDAPTINQIIAADYSAVQSLSNTPFDVNVNDLTRDTEYDTYCFARDRGTENGAVSPNPGNDIAFSTVLVSKRDVHTIGDSTPPSIPIPPNPTGFQPPQNSVGIGIQETFVFTFSEDVTMSSAFTASSAYIRFYDMDNTGTNNKQIDFNEPSTNDGTVSIVNNVMTVTWEASYQLNANTNYDVQLADGVLEDAAGNAFPGLGGATAPNTNANRISYAVKTR